MPSHPELHPEGALGRRLPRVHRAGERQPGQTCWPPRSARTRSPSTARCCRRGTQRRLDLGGLHPGFPGDTRESIMRDLEIIKKELPLDILEFFMLTPLPGSEDHQTLWKKGVWMDPDLNKYDLNHRVVHHPKMSDAEYEQTYRDAWRTYYTRRAHRDGGAPPWRHSRPQPAEPAQFMTMFKIMFEAENIHPLEGGIVRLKYRRDRRYGMPIEPVGVFHFKLLVETFRKLKNYGKLAWQGWRIGQKVLHDPKRHEYHGSPRCRRWSRRTSTSSRCSPRRRAVVRALSKRRGEDLARAKVAAKQNQQRLEAAE